MYFSLSYQLILSLTTSPTFPPLAIGHDSLQFAYILLPIDKHTIGGFPITSCPACFLVIALQ
jgi:hypothetical protein